jgi:pimeloyl-ACP methyl ester carboxylesterase
VKLPAFIEAQLPDGVRHADVRAGGEHVHVMEWGPRDGRAIVLVHGNPTWGFLWRKVVAAVRARDPSLRLIAPDLVGLGLSSRPPASAYTLANQAAWLGEALDEIAPGPLVLVAQDWGGSIGLRAMVDRASRLRGIVLGNTAVGPPAKSFKPTLFHRLSQMPVVSDVLFRGLGFPLGVLHMSQGDRGSIRGDVARAYRWPLRTIGSRVAPLALARMVPDSHAHPSIPDLAKSEELYRTAQVPIALVWGMKDPILGRVVGHLARLRPDASVVKTGAGHFLQEEVPDELATAIVDVAKRATW